MSRRYQLKTATAPERALNYEGLLNDQQIAVVEAGEGPVLVIAGAGSGKTRTLTWRVARLLADGVQPESILLLTFTNKAAREMLGRVAEVCRVDTRRLTGGTFHHVAHQVLRDHMDDLHRLSAILIERETIDKDQFERLLAGEPEEDVFREETPPAPIEEPTREPAKRPRPQPKPSGPRFPPSPG